MMWNFLVGGLLAGSAIVLYDGQPDPSGCGSFAAEAGVTCFGTSAGFIGACMKAGVEPPPLPRLRSVGSTGSPLPVEGFEWVYEHARRRVAVLDQRRHRSVHRVRGRVPGAAGARGRAAGALRWARRSRPGTRTAARSWTRSASW